MLGFGISDSLATLACVTRLDWVRLSLRLTRSSIQVLRGSGYPVATPGQLQAKRIIAWWTPFIPQDEPELADAPEYTRGHRGAGIQPFHGGEYYTRRANDDGRTWAVTSKSTP